MTMSWFLITNLSISICILACLLKWGINKVAFPAWLLRYDDSAEFLSEKSTENFVVSCKDGCKVSMLVLNKRYLRDARKMVVVYSHGNAEVLSRYMKQHMQSIANRLSCTVVCYDYSGYGSSTGSPCEQSVTDNLNSVIACLHVPDSRIVLVGRSIGSGPTMAVAAHRRFAGVCLISPFTSIVRVKLPFTIPFLDMFDNLAHARHVECPVVIVHGDEDEIIPLQHSQQLASRIPGSTLVVKKGVGHNDMDADSDIIEFVEKLQRQRNSRPLGIFIYRRKITKKKQS